MRLPFLAVSVCLCTILAVPSQLGAQQGVPVSLDRIREGLSRPPPLLDVAGTAGDMSTPAFHVEIRTSPFVLRPPDNDAFDPTYGLPSVAELLLTGIEKAVDYKRRRAERRARKEVADALAAFCAIRGCPTPKVDSTPDLGRDLVVADRRQHADRSDPRTK